MTYYLDKAYLAYNIIRVKSKYINEKFTTFNELDSITKSIENDFTDENNNVISYDDYLNYHLFEIDNVIELNRKKFISLQNFDTRYKTFCSEELCTYLSCDEYICKKVIEVKKEQIKNLRKYNKSKEKSKILVKLYS